MKRFFQTAAVATAIAIFTSCASNDERTGPAPTSGTDGTEVTANDEQTVRAIFEQYDRAWLEEDAGAFDRLLADEFTLIDPAGRVLSKADVLGMLRSGDLKLDIGKSDDVKIRFYGDTALVASRWTEKSTFKGKPFSGVMRATVVFVKNNGDWQAVSDQVTPITAEARQ